MKHFCEKLESGYETDACASKVVQFFKGETLLLFKRRFEKMTESVTVQST